ncbi:MAG: hypothetical protein O7C75_13875 [Verrucomicrobia bacterium]|nr:hypothetical protein [Verrucomicrobiota bacterium]
MPTVFSSSGSSNIDVYSKTGSIGNRVVKSRRDDFERVLWGLLHLSDGSVVIWQDVGKIIMRLLERNTDGDTNEEFVVGSPNWTFLCGKWCVGRDSLVFPRDSQLIAVLQIESNQLKLTTYHPMSAQLVATLFQIAQESQSEYGTGDSFWQRTRNLILNQDIESKGYCPEFVAAGNLLEPVSPDKQPILDQLIGNQLPSAMAATQTRILYKYG